MCCATQIVFAQLPDINVVNLRGRNYVTFKNQYDQLAKIEIQRSNDSTRGYVTIGTLTKPKKGDGTFADPKPLLGLNTYQLRIVFNEEMDWYSKRKSLTCDSAMLIAPALPAGTIETPIELAVRTETPVAVAIPEPQFTFTASTHIFTNNFTGHINIELENTIEKRYSLIFYDHKNTEALRIDRVGKDKIILDKHNFNGKGMYKFVLKESGAEVENGFVRVD
jgi:hypothetical protein